MLTQQTFSIAAAMHDVLQSCSMGLQQGAAGLRWVNEADAEAHLPALIEVCRHSSRCLPCCSGAQKTDRLARWRLRRTGGPEPLQPNRAQSDRERHQVLPGQRGARDGADGARACAARGCHGRRRGPLARRLRARLPALRARRAREGTCPPTLPQCGAAAHADRLCPPVLHLHAGRRHWFGSAPVPHVCASDGRRCERHQHARRGLHVRALHAQLAAVRLLLALH